VNAAARAALAGAVDYAGLFPPAGLSMAAAAGNYRKYLASQERWALGRFVCPAARLDELASELEGGDDGWEISATASVGGVADALAAVRRFNAGGSHAQVTAFEAPLEALPTPTGIEAYWELDPASADFEAQAAAVKDAGAFAKLRTGGIHEQAIPSVARVLRFLEVCRRLDLPFKATAGLHHALRGRYPLTYEANAAQVTMHGFLNLMLATAALPDSAAARSMLEGDTLPAAELSEDRVTAARRWFRGFGSCSFEEPLQCLTDLSSTLRPR